MTCALSEWSEQALQELLLLPETETGTRYRDPEIRGHYSRTAQTLNKHTNDLTLSRAAFLLGLKLGEPEAELFLDRLPQEDRRIKVILGERRKLSSLRSAANVGENMLQSFLAALKEPASAMLFVAEQLDRIDPADKFGEFSRSFHHTPGLQPIVARPKPPDDDLALLTRVVIPSAEHFGLWSERNLAEDMILFYTEPELFESCCKFVREQHVRSEIDSWLTVITNQVQPAAVRWHWHHVAGIANRWRSDAATTPHWTQRLSTAGCVTVTCSDIDQCYAALGRIHSISQFTYRPKELADSLRYPTASGYGVIRTMLFAKSRRPQVRVEIFPIEVSEKRYRRLNPDCLSRTGSLSKDLNTMQVFASDGSPYHLPEGSCVLNLAVKIHSEVLCHAKGALVNRERVGILHPLEAGDVVQIEVGTEIIPLPEDWKTAVPPSTIHRIQRAHRLASSQVLSQQGVAVLRGALRKRGITDCDRMDDQVLTSYAEDAIAELHKSEHWPSSASSWFIQLGLLNEAEDHGQSRFAGLPATALDDLADGFVKVYNRESRVLRHTIIFKDGFRPKFDELTLCPDCEPVPGKEGVGVFKDQQLIIHSKGSSCTDDGIPVEIQPWHVRGQYITIEMTNRTGIASEVLQLVAKHGIDLAEHAGDYLASGWAVLRFQVRGLSSVAIDRLAKEIRQIDGVSRVFLPPDPELPALEGSLPPRFQSSALLRRSQNPYYYGAPVEDDHHFYGREYERHQLSQTWNTVIAGSTTTNLCFVTGPNKIGKTSLVYSFLREVLRADRGCITVPVTSSHNSWEIVAGLLRMRLLHELKLHLVRTEIDVNQLRQFTLEQLINYLAEGNKHRLVVFIDEAVGMLDNTRSEMERRSFQHFLALIENMRGAMLILAGPCAPLEALLETHRALFRRAKRIKLSGMIDEEVAMLLRAAKLTNNVRGRFTDSLIQRICNYTSGTPNWCNLIAHEGFELRRARGSFDYDDDLFEAARAKVLDEHPTAFLDRYDLESAEPELRKATRRILEAMADSRARGGTTEARLLKAARSVTPTMRHAELVACLIRLEEAGSVRRNPSKKDRLWSLGAPILRDFIRRASTRAWRSDHSL